MEEFTKKSLTSSESTDGTPGDRLEHDVAELWAQLLDLEQVGCGDNFLVLGGESLLAAQAMARIKSRFNVDVTLRSVLIGTVKEVAQEIRDALGGDIPPTA
jgi:mycobactin peptide synthetase MbtE